MNSSGYPPLSASSDARRRTSEPMVTGTSILAIKFNHGVMVAGDMLASFGSLAKYRCVSRIKVVGPPSQSDCVIAASGDISDFQQIQRLVDHLTTNDNNYDDGARMKPMELHKYLTRVMYNRRSKMDPLWNSIVVAGVRDGERFLGLVDMQGGSYEEDLLATGFGSHLALPIMRDAFEKYGTQMTEDQARTVLLDCLRVLFYRDCRASNKVQIAVLRVGGDGATGSVELTPESQPIVLETKWDYQRFVHPAGAAVGSW